MDLTIALVACAACTLTSPDGHIGVDVRVTHEHTLTSAVSHDGKTVILASSLGLELKNADLAHKLANAKTSFLAGRHGQRMGESVGEIAAAARKSV